MTMTHSTDSRAADVASGFSRTSRVMLPILIAASAAVLAQQPATPPPAQQPSSVELRLTGDPGTPPRMAVPDLLALTPDRETQEAARAISEVLWDDLNFEREFALIPRDTYKSIPAAGSIDAVPFDRWRELGADGVIIGTTADQRGVASDWRSRNTAPAGGARSTGAHAGSRDAGRRPGDQ